MAQPLFDTLLDKIRTNPANHNRWKLLAHYPNQTTAKVTATKLRDRYPDLVFTVAPYNNRWAVGALYKHLDPTGRIPTPQRPTQNPSDE
jgi:hypothetical protein